MQAMDTWAVAAAILIPRAKRYLGLHYCKVAERVIETGLTKLGTHGSAPSQTIGVILRTKTVHGRGVFRSMRYRGCYMVDDVEFAEQLPEVRLAVEQIEKLEVASRHEAIVDSLEAENKCLKDRLAALQKRNDKLERAVKRIAGISGGLTKTSPVKRREK